ncbi:hypothetical protein TWF694_009917 [Orbilia ellipsospora]|uniref:HMA domain-containing protein n=1 Tax=Orbilia ellipsospora TaxID=2528407 RepID=A0AAV9XCM9_9PEZI
MDAHEGDKISHILPSLREKLGNVYLEAAIWDATRIDLTEVQCCHELKDPGKNCGCIDECWSVLAAILCKYNLHDKGEITRVPWSAHAVHEKFGDPGPSCDISFTTDTTDSQGSSSCQSSDSNNEHTHTHDRNHHDIEDTESDHHHHHESDDNSSSLGNEKTPGRNDLRGVSVPEALKPIIHDLPHALVTKHHHHYQILNFPDACAFHEEFVARKRARSQRQCVCAWITGIMLLVFPTTEVAQLCCKTMEEKHISTRSCCLDDHSLDSELRDSAESLPTEASSLVPAKSLKYLILGVTGMTCTSCETKLKKALKKIKGIEGKGTRGVRTNFMLGRAELWYDSKIIDDPAEGICEPVEKESGFKCKVMRDTTGSGTSSNQRVRIRTNLPENTTFKAISDHIVRLKGVKGAREVDEHLEMFRARFLDIFRRNSSSKVLKDDPEKGMVGQTWRIFDVTYDQHSLHIRNLLQYTRTFSRGSPKIEVELVDMEDPEVTISRQSRAELRHMLWLTIFTSLLTLPILILTWTPRIKTQVPSPFDMDTRRLRNFVVYQSVCFLLATIVQACGVRIYKNAFRSVFRQGRLDMDCLVMISTMSAYIYSFAYYGINITREIEKMTTGHPPEDAERERHDPIFEASSLLITLILGGRLLTGYIRLWAANRISVGSLQPKVCRRSYQRTFRPIKNRIWKTENVRLLHYGDVLHAEAGDIVVTDGVVVGGDAMVDESHISGEAKPRELQRNASIIAGSKVIGGKLEYRVTRLISENTISSMKRLVTAASGKRPKMQEFADRVAAWLTPAVLLIALLACIGWAVYYRTAKANVEDTNSAISKAITVAITVLAISCPCAIALAVPTVHVFASQLGIKNGIVIKSPESLEKSTKIRFFVADKTGTLTTGKLEVAAAKYWVNGAWEGDIRNRDLQALQYTIYRLIARDQHPVAKAVTEMLGRRHNRQLTPLDDDTNIRSIVGRGIEGTIDGRRLRGGKPSWVLQDRIKNFSKPIFEEVVEKYSRTPFVVVDVRTDAVLAVFGLSDTVRPEAPDVIAKLLRQNVECYMMSGDEKSVCLQVAQQVGILPCNVIAGCSPEDKVREIRILQQRAEMEIDFLKLHGCFFTRFFKRFRVCRKCVMFVGDGTNDAPALTQADIGVTMSNCSEVAAGCADVGIISSSLNGISALHSLSKRTMTRIGFNFAWALKYNLAAIVLSLGIVPWSIPPQYAGIGELVSVAPLD